MGMALGLFGGATMSMLRSLVFRLTCRLLSPFALSWHTVPLGVQISYLLADVVRVIPWWGARRRDHPSLPRGGLTSLGRPFPCHVKRPFGRRTWRGLATPGTYPLARGRPPPLRGVSRTISGWSLFFVSWATYLSLLVGAGLPPQVMVPPIHDVFMCAAPSTHIILRTTPLLLSLVLRMRSHPLDK